MPSAATKSKTAIVGLEVDVRRSLNFVSLKRFYKLIMHANYEVPISYSWKYMAKVKDFPIDKTKSRCPLIPFWGHKKIKLKFNIKVQM